MRGTPVQHEEPDARLQPFVDDDPRVGDWDVPGWGRIEAHVVRDSRRHSRFPAQPSARDFRWDHDPARKRADAPLPTAANHVWSFSWCDRRCCGEIFVSMVPPVMVCKSRRRNLKTARSLRARSLPSAHCWDVVALTEGPGIGVRSRCRGFYPSLKMSPRNRRLRPYWCHRGHRSVAGGRQ
jgi:hypothetical protein